MALINTIILWWSGAIVDIPDGWALCDGNNDLPDLRDRFIVGAEGSYPQDDTGGSSPHNHTATSDSHVHGVTVGPDIPVAGGSAGLSNPAYPTFTANNTPNIPKYYALALIGKI